MKQNKIEIPIYRAKKIGSDEYVIGYFYQPTHFISDGGKIICHRTYETFSIDVTTLAIHFNDMTDSQVNKIFASLSEDGKGGDILYYEDDCQPYICEHSSDGTFLFEYLDNKTIKNYICRLSQEKVLFEDLKVIGIQE